MHKIALPPAIVERAQRRRGALHVFPSIEPRRTALLVVDMQNVFCAEGEPCFVPGAVDIIPNINQLAVGLREAGGLVVWIKMAATDPAAGDWTMFFEHFNGPALSRAMRRSMTPGSAGFALHPDLRPGPGDIESVKTRFSALIQGSSDLDEVLRSRGIDTVIVTGTVTNVCCESTARDANMLNYKVIMVSDANAARSDDEHNASLGNLLNMFADVRSTEETLALFTPERLRAAG